MLSEETAPRVLETFSPPVQCHWGSLCALTPGWAHWVVMCMKRLEQGIQWYPLTICWRGRGTGILLRTQATPVFFLFVLLFRMLLARLQIAEQT